MKKVFMILAMVFIMATLVACGSDKITSNNPTNEVVATPDSTTETQQNEETVTNEAIESNNQTDTPTDAGLAAYAGAYTDGTNYLVIEGENITLNGRKCEVTRAETDHFKSGIPVYYFIYENNEISIYYDEVCGMGCSLEQPEGSWLTYETIDITNVPQFDVKDEQVADNEQTVDQGQKAEVTQSQGQSDTESFSYVGVTFVSDEGNTLVINEVDDKGYPTSISFDGNRESLSERDNFNKTDSSWSLGVVWSRDADGNQLLVSDIGYENFNGKETIWIHGSYGGDYKFQK